MAFLIAVGPHAEAYATGAMAAGLGHNQIVAALDAEEATVALKPLLREGDAVLVKGSHFMGLERLVAAVAGKEGALMLYYLYHFSSHWGPLNVFRYETFRAMAAALTALLLSLALGPKTIVLLTRLKLGQPLRQKSEVRELADLHSGKKGTPTMGGILILFTVTISSLLWCDPANQLYWLVLGSMLYLGFIGFADDYEKVAKKNSQGHSRLAEAGGAGAAGDLRLHFTCSYYLRLSGRVEPSLHSVSENAGGGRHGRAGRRLFRAGHHGHVQRGEPDRRARRPGHRLLRSAWR